jgi:oligopeptide/dipeptide ABC transporter ATP-binding protein
MDGGAEELVSDGAEVISLSGVKTWFYLDEGALKALDGVTFRVRERETLGLIGESGCGKSVTAQSILRIVPPPGRIVGGSITLTQNGNRVDLASLMPNGQEIRSIRGKEISMIFQEPMTSLSPVHTIGSQIEEVILLHKTPVKAEARELAVEMLARVGIPDPGQRVNAYPHQLSGGLRQRAMIAMALSCNPKLLIADEPTTALDVTVQAQILELMAELQEQLGMAILYITHSLGVIAEIADNVAVMYLGRIVESADVHSIFHHPLHPYTVDLMKSIPKVGRKARTRLAAIKGSVPVPLNLPVQCPFFPRCSRAMPGLCDRAVPALHEVEAGHQVRCFLSHREEERPDGTAQETARG